MKYLVVYDAGSGYAEICNVAVVKPKQNKTLKMKPLKYGAFHKIIKTGFGQETSKKYPSHGLSIGEQKGGDAS